MPLVPGRILHKLVCGDSLVVLPSLPSGFVDAVVTDPPYAQTNEGYDSNIACKSDIWRECYRVCKDNAALIAFAGSPTYHKIATAVEQGGWKVRQMWGWVYRDGFMITAYPNRGFDRLAPAFDPIVFATKGVVLLNLEKEGKPWKTTTRRSGSNYSERSGTVGATEGSGHYPRTITSDGTEPFEYFAHPRSNGYRKEMVGHPNQKPLALMKWLVSKVPGDMILDPFAGSGTTLVAAKELGKRVIGIEMNQGYVEMFSKRMKDRLGD